MAIINDATVKHRRGPAADWISEDPTLNQGEWGYETDTGAFKLGDGVLAWTDLEYRQRIPFTNDLTSGNITHTLPKITGFPQTESIYWQNGGTFKLTLAVTDSETVGGVPASIWEGEGEGHMIVESDGTNWQVREYEDAEPSILAGWKKELDGTLICMQSDSGTRTFTTSAGGAFYDATFSFGNYPKSFIGNVPIISGSTIIGGAFSFIGYAVSPTITASGITPIALISAASQDYEIRLTAIGRWRT